MEKAARRRRVAALDEAYRQRRSPVRTYAYAKWRRGIERAYGYHQ